MSKIAITVKDSTIKAVSDQITSGSIGTVPCEFTFDSSWDGFSKTAVFYQDKDNMEYAVLGTTLLNCGTPFEVLLDVNPLYIGVYGTNAGQAKATPFAVVELVEGAYRPGTVPPPPSPDVYVQILNLIEAYRQDNSNNAAVALASKQVAESSAESAEISKTEAQNIKNSIETAEPQRAASEQLRITAENERAAAENERKTAESSRDAYEEDRNIDETTRCNNENSRKSAENNRANAENGRATAEQNSVAAENERKTAENNRATAENARTAFYDNFGDYIAKLNRGIGAGVVNGLEVTAQNPTSPNKVNVSSGIANMPSGKQYILEKQTIEFSEKGSGNFEFYNIVYVSAEGAISFVEGQCNVPTPPSAPDGGILLAVVNQHECADNILQADITDTRVYFIDSAKINADSTANRVLSTKNNAEIKDIERTLANSNPNNEPRIEITTADTIVSLPKNAAQGGLLGAIKGMTLKNEASYNRNTWEEWNIPESNVTADNTGIEFTSDGSNYIQASLPTNVRVSTKYGILYSVVNNSVESAFGLGGTISTYPVLSKTVGNNKKVFTTKDAITTNSFGLLIHLPTEPTGNKIKIKDIRMFELPTGSTIETDFNTLTADQLAAIYPYIDGTQHNTVTRLRSVGKNSLSMHSTKIKTGSLLTGETKQSMFKDYDIIVGMSYNAYYEPSVISNWIIKPITNTAILKSSSNGYGIGFKLKANEGDIFSSNNINIKFGAFDKDGNSLSYDSNTPFTCPTNTSFIFIVLAPPYNELTTLSNLQIEEGTTSTEYVPYTESVMYIEPFEHKRLPNDVCDITDLATGQRTQKTKYDILSGTKITGIANLSGADIIYSTIADMVKSGTSASLSNAVYIPDKKQVTLSQVTSNPAENIGNYYTYNGVIYFVVEAGHDLAYWQNCDNFTQDAYYEFSFDKYIVTKNVTNGVLTSYPSGTFYVERAWREVEFYTTNFTLTNSNYPIKILEKLYKYNQENGTETPLDVSLAVIASDGWNFTHPSLAYGDLSYASWFYDYNGVNGVNTLSYLDSSKVVPDTTNGKFYVHPKPIYTNGVLVGWTEPVEVQ